MKARGLTQIKLSNMSNTSLRFIGKLERSKPTIELNKALYVAYMLGLNINTPDED